MKSGPFDYHDPRTVDEAVALLGALENAKLLAGGQSLMPMLNMRYVLPDHVIDLNRVEGLAGISAAGDGIRIGAMTRQRALERDDTIKARLTIVQEALTYIGHVATRSRGTFGGSLSHLDPAAELPAIALLCDATMEVAGPRGPRSVAAKDWHAGYMQPAIESDEILVAATLPAWKEPHGFGFVEFARRHGDFAIAGAGALLALDASRTIRRAAIVVLGCGIAPVRLTEAEVALVGQKADAAAFAAAGEMARKVEAISDAHVSGAYRQQLAATLTKRALTRAAERA
jgi:carbon-monoxide dehydrogenase medium subunit